MCTSHMFYKTGNQFCFGENSTGMLKILEYVINPGLRSIRTWSKIRSSWAIKVKCLTFFIKKKSLQSIFI